MMISRTVLILAAGRQTRWEQDRRFPASHKQLLDVGGETIIRRILRQCRERGTEPRIITHHQTIVDAFGMAAYAPTKRRWTVETLLCTLEEMTGKERTIVLLGDTVYSRTVMDRIFACQNPVRVFGSEYEIFAVSFHQNASSAVADALQKAIEHAEAGGPGKLRKFYQAYCGLDLDSADMEEEVLDYVCYKRDYTRDVDTPRDYIQLLNRVVRGELLDDECEIAAV